MVLNRLFSLRCPECGEKIVEDDTCCPNCGTNLETPIQQGRENKEKSGQYLEEAQKQYDKGSNLKFALEYCELAIEYDPSSAVAHNLQGLILDALRQPEKAIKAYEDALRIDPSYEDAQANLLDARSETERRALDLHHKKKIILNLVIAFAGVAVVFCVGVAALAVYKFMLPLIGPKVTIILEPDHSLVSIVDPAELEDAVQVLEERSRSLGYTGISFEISENGLIICKIPTSMDVQIFTKRVLAIGLLEFVDFGTTSVSPGTIVATDFDSLLLHQPDGTKWHTVMTNAEIAEAVLSSDTFERPAVSFLLTPEGKDIFLEHTTNNVGKYLGIVLDKVVVSCPVINQPIPDGSGIIQGLLSQEEAEDLAAYLAIDPLPIPLVVKEVKQ
jgi:uncharacterized Zn finger protein (UPF0148 family)